MIFFLKVNLLIFFLYFSEIKDLVVFKTFDIAKKVLFDLIL